MSAATDERRSPPAVNFDPDGSGSCDAMTSPVSGGQPAARRRQIYSLDRTVESRIRTWKEEKHPDHFSARVAAIPDATAQPRADRDPHGGVGRRDERWSVRVMAAGRCRTSAMSRRVVRELTVCWRRRCRTESFHSSTFQKARRKKIPRPAVQDKQIYLAPPAAPVLRVRGDSGSVGPAIGAGSEPEPTEA